MSSRNAYLSASERKTATQLYNTLCSISRSIAAGETGATAINDGTNELINAGFDKVDYIAIRDADSLGTIDTFDGRPVRILAAAWLGETRLIDNIAHVSNNVSNNASDQRPGRRMP